MSRGGTAALPVFAERATGADAVPVLQAVKFLVLGWARIGSDAEGFDF